MTGRVTERDTADSARRWILRGLLAALLFAQGCASQPYGWLTGLTPQRTALADIRGQLRPASGLEDLLESSVVVVFADPLSESRGDRAPRRAVTIRRLDQSFVPSFSVVSVAQPVHFREDGHLYHRIFSYSEPNTFDLGTLAAGTTKSVVFDHPGLVRFYCSLHSGESGAIFVAPSRYFDTVRSGGEYELVGLPPGDYRVATWSETLSGNSKDVTIAAGQIKSLELSVESLREAE